jgi:hypothetical protein
MSREACTADGTIFLCDDTQQVDEILGNNAFWLYDGYAVAHVYCPGGDEIGWGFSKDPRVPLGHCIKPFHHFVTSWFRGYQIDHINRNRLDNRGCNLRRVTPAVNGLNRKVNKLWKHGVEGLSRCRVIGGGMGWQVRMIPPDLPISSSSAGAEGYVYKSFPDSKYGNDPEVGRVFAETYIDYYRRHHLLHIEAAPPQSAVPQRGGVAIEDLLCSTSILPEDSLPPPPDRRTSISIQELLNPIN